MIVQHPISKQWATPAIVTEVGPNHDYIVKTPAGRLLRRNRRMLRKRISVIPGKSTRGPSIQPAPTQSPLPEENPATAKPVKHDIHRRCTKTIDTQDETTRTFP